MGLRKRSTGNCLRSRYARQRDARRLPAIHETVHPVPIFQNFPMIVSIAGIGNTECHPTFMDTAFAVNLHGVVVLSSMCGVLDIDIGACLGRRDGIDSLSVVRPFRSTRQREKIPREVSDERQGWGIAGLAQKTLGREAVVSVHLVRKTASALIRRGRGYN